MIKKIILAVILIGGFGAISLLAYKNSPKEETGGVVESAQEINTSNNINIDTQTNNMEEQNKAKENMAVLETNLGSIKIELYDKDAPKTAENFRDLIKKGFYNGLTFHRIISGFMIQGGDPNCGNLADSSKIPSGPCGTGGPGYQFADELDPTTPSAKEGYKKGVVAMANSGPNTNGSQFFIMHKDYPLPHNYTIFGKVISGFEVVDAIALSEVGPSDRPVQAISINKAFLIE